MNSTNIPLDVSLRYIKVEDIRHSDTGSHARLYFDPDRSCGTGGESPRDRLGGLCLTRTIDGAVFAALSVKPCRPAPSSQALTTSTAALTFDALAVFRISTIIDATPATCSRRPVDDSPLTMAKRAR